MPSAGFALGGCPRTTHFVPFAAAAPCEPAAGEQAVPHAHPVVSSKLQDFWSVHGKSWWEGVLKALISGTIWLKIKICHLSCYDILRLDHLSPRRHFAPCWRTIKFSIACHFRTVLTRWRTRSCCQSSARTCTCRGWTWAAVLGSPATPLWPCPWAARVSSTSAWRTASGWTACPCAAWLTTAGGCGRSTSPPAASSRTTPSATWPGSARSWGLCRWQSMPTSPMSRWRRWPRTAGAWSSWTWRAACGSGTSPSGMPYLIFKTSPANFVLRPPTTSLMHPSLKSSVLCCAHRTLAEYCPKLQSLKVNHCHNVTESSLDPLRKRNVVIDVEPPLQRALVLLQDVLGFAPFINLQI